MNFCLISTFIIITINIINATQSITFINNKFTISHNELFDSIMKNDFNDINRITNDKNDSTAIKSSSTLLNKQIKVIKSNQLDFDNKQINGEKYNILFGHDGTIWLLSEQNVVVAFNNMNEKISNFKINDFFSSPYNKKLMIFTETKSKQIYKTKNGFQEYDTKSLPFKPEAFYFIKDQDVLLASETTLDNLINFWLSVDFGDNWFMLKNDLTELPKWGKNSIYYLDTASKRIIKFDLIKFKNRQNKDNDAISSSNQILENIENVVDFKLIHETLFIKTVKNDGSFVLVKSHVKSNKRGPKRYNQILNLNGLNLKDFEVLSFTEHETLIKITHQTENDEIKNDLFKSIDKEMINFELSRNDISQNKINKIKSSSELISLNERGKVYIANFMHLNEKRTYMKSASDDDWNLIEFDNPKYNDYNLDLNRNFNFAHQISQSLLSEPKLPEFMIATATSPTSKSFVCVYDRYKNQWRKILDGNYLYSIADSGRIIVAVEMNKKTNEITYSFDNGNSWQKHKFTRKLVIIDNLIKDPFEYTQSFTLFARNAFTKDNMIFKVDFVNDLDKIGNQIKFNCNQTCIDKSLFEEVCVNDQNENDTQKCLINVKNNYKPRINFISLIDIIDFKKMSEYQKYVFYLNQYLVPILIALASAFLVLALIVVAKSKLSHKNGQKGTQVMGKFVSIIKYFKQKKQTVKIYNFNDNECLINNNNNIKNDKSIYMLNLA